VVLVNIIKNVTKWHIACLLWQDDFYKLLGELYSRQIKLSC